MSTMTTTTTTGHSLIIDKNVVKRVCLVFHSSNEIVHVRKKSLKKKQSVFNFNNSLF